MTVQGQNVNPIQGLIDLQRTVEVMRSRAAAIRPVLQEIAVAQTSSFIQNFRDGGRPAWIPSKKTTKGGDKKTLIESGRLMHSVTQFELLDDGVVFGTNLPYGAIHQFGGEIRRSPQVLAFRSTKKGNRFASRKWTSNKKSGAVRIAHTSEYTIRIPARPYIVFQPEDIEFAGAAVSRYLLGGR